MSMTTGAMPVKEPVLTPGGFIKMDRVRVGTVVRTPDGGTAEVTDVRKHSAIQTYRVAFSDGSEAVCTADSVWLTRIMGQKESTALRTTQDVMEAMARGDCIITPLCLPADFEGGGEAPIKPYTMGAILGDGCTKADVIQVIKRDMELFDRIREDGYELKRYYADSERTPVFALKKFSQEKAWLKEKGLLCRSYKKYVPAEYMQLPLEERMELIRGLMDTDGFSSTNGTCVYTTTSRRLARNVQWLIRSIGGTAGIHSYIPVCTFKDGTKKKCRRAYTVRICVPDNSILFTLPRKRVRCLNRKIVRDGFHPRRKIVSINDNGVKDCISITLDRGDSFITRDFTMVRTGQNQKKNF